ncbi:MAG: GtrA family protein [Candidatus Nomurabacteria bacterium]|nr:GtrA family protein [Candidatus Nomurabacteria bacterium]
MKEQIEKTTRYLFAGGAGAGINFFLYFFLISIFHIWYIFASVISFTLSTFAGFYLQKHITFKNKDRQNEKKQISYYYIVSLINLILNVIILSFFVEILHIGPVLAKIFSLAILAIWSFFVYQKIIFK